jgi:hypothetical protein
MHRGADEQTLSGIIAEVLSEYGEAPQEIGAEGLQKLSAERFLRQAAAFLKGRDDREHLLEQLRGDVLGPLVKAPPAETAPSSSDEPNAE